MATRRLELDTLVVKIVADATSLTRAVRQSVTAMGLLGRAIASAAKLTGVLSVAFVDLARRAVREYAKFDKALTESQAIMKLTGTEAEEMKRVALDLGKETVFGPEELAGAYYFLASAGLNAAQSIKALPIVARFAAASVLELKEASELLTGSQAAIGLRVKDATQNMLNMVRTSDVIVQANNMAQASAKQFAQALSSDSAATARSFGKNLEEVVSVLMVYADQNIKGRIAGSHYARMLRYLSTLAVKNKGQFQKLGIAVFDENKEMRNLADIIEDVDAALGKLNAESRATALEMLGFKALTQRAVLPLLGMGHRIREYEAALRSAGGATKEVAEKQLHAFSNQLKMVWNNIKVVLIGIGEMLSPAVALFGQVVKGAAEAWERLPLALRATVVGTVAAAGAFMVLATAVAFAGIVFNLLFGGLGIWMGLMTLLVTGVLAYFGTALGAAAGVAVWLMGGIEGITKKLKEFWEWILPVRQAMASLTQTAIYFGAALGSIFKTYALILFKMELEGLGFKFNDLRDIAVAAIYFIEFAILNIDKTFEIVNLRMLLAGAVLISELKAYWFQFLGFFKSVWDFAAGTVQTYLENMGTLMRNAGAFFVDVFFEWGRSVLDFFNVLFTNITEKVFTFFGNINRIRDNLRKLAFNKVKLEDLIQQPKELKFKGFDPKVIRADLTKGVKEAGKFQAPVWEREVTEQEKQIELMLGKLELPFAQDFNKFLFDKMAMQLRQQGPVDEAAQEKGKNLGEDLAGPAKKQLASLDSALYRSAESIRRWEAYQARITRTPGERLAAGREAAKAPGAEAARRQEQQVDLLKKLVKAAEDQLKRDPVKLEGAAL